jgi:hypothetical protein
MVVIQFTWFLSECTSNHISGSIHIFLCLNHLQPCSIKVSPVPFQSPWQIVLTMGSSVSLHMTVTIIEYSVLTWWQHHKQTMTLLPLAWKRTKVLVHAGSFKQKMYTQWTIKLAVKFIKWSWWVSLHPTPQVKILRAILFIPLTCNWKDLTTFRFQKETQIRKYVSLCRPQPQLKKEHEHDQ